VKSLWSASRTLALAFSVLVLLVAAACGDDGDDPTPTPDTDVTAAQATPDAVTPEPATPVADATPAATNTPVAVAETPTPAAPAATPTSPATPTAVAVAPTPTVPASTPTPSIATPPAPGIETPTVDGETPFDDVEFIDPEALPNFSLTFTMEIAGVPDEEDTRIEMAIEQSALDNYHMRLVTDETTIETWLVDGVSYIGQDDGTVLEIPGGPDAALFSPSLFLQVLPPLSAELNAQEIGQETVNGRQTTHYRIGGRDFLAMSDLFLDEHVSDVTGNVDVWIDNELNIMIRQIGDVTWQLVDGSTGSMTTNYEMNNIGTTPPVQSPR
jgi:hypothetical protein